MNDGFGDAVRALLDQPLIATSDPAALALVRRHRVELRKWFADELGYRLDATRRDVVRLAKLPGPGHVPRGVKTRQGRRFDGRRYALVCLVLAAVEASGERCTLAELFDDVAARAAGVDRLDFDADTGADRRSFIQGVQAVADLGVLERAEGEEDQFARGVAGADALYRIDRERLALLPTAPQPPSLAASPDDVGFEPYPDTEFGRSRRRRHRVTRALIEEPVVYSDDLDVEEHTYFRLQRGRLERLLDEVVGLSLEIRSEGFVAVDEHAELTDLRWPDFGSAQTAALRICDELRARRVARCVARCVDGRNATWADSEVVEFVRSLADEYRGRWRKHADTDAGAAELATEAVDILVSARLVERVIDGIEAMDAIGRFATADTDQPDRAAKLTGIL